jgi:hypothetical protein
LCLCTEVIDEQTAFFDFLHPSGKHFKWPHKTDKQRIHLAGILCEIFVEPVSNGKPISSTPVFSHYFCKIVNTNVLHLETRMKILKDIFKMIFLNNSITI